MPHSGFVIRTGYRHGLPDFSCGPNRDMFNSVGETLHGIIDNKITIEIKMLPTETDDLVSRRSFIKRLRSILWRTAALFYLTTLAGILIGGNYLIEKNLEKQAHQLLLIFQDIATPLLGGSDNAALAKISTYAAPIGE